MPPPPAMAPYQPPAGQYTYAGFWIRVVARLLDSVIVALPMAALFVLLAILAGAFAGTASNSNDQNAQNAAGALFGGVFVLFYLLALFVGVAYWVYFWGTSGQTLGMRALKLRVVDATTGGPIGISRALVRWLMTIVNTWACYIGWIWVAFDPRKQGWHDKVASSVVLQG